MQEKPVYPSGGGAAACYDGALAAVYASAHAQRLAGLVLLAAYPTHEIPDALTEVLLVGSEDRIVNWDRIETGRQFAPSNYTEAVIEGGNHAQFGSYGPQLGDGTASISADEQIGETVRVITDALLSENH